MSWLAEVGLNFHNWRNGVTKVKEAVIQTQSPIRIGILGAALINYTAIIDPVQTHPDAIIVGIAARSMSRAEAQITKYGLKPHCKAYGSYDELLNDKSIDAVYIPLPNGLHAEWTIKAMNCGKHVLVEKPIASNAVEARKIREASEKTGKIALEAFHWRFHPVAIRVQNLIDSGKYGNITNIDSTFLIPRWALGGGDIRFSYDLAGGANMDLTYVYSACRFFTGDTGDVRVIEAKARVSSTDAKIDERTTCDFVIERENKPRVQCHTTADLSNPPLFGLIPRFWEMMPVITIHLEKAKIDFPSFIQPAFGSGIVIHKKDQHGQLSGSPIVDKDLLEGAEQSYGDCGGQTWWTTYRWQLEAFVGKIRAIQQGRSWGGPWMSLDQSVGQMQVIDAVYDKAGLPRRGL